MADARKERDFGAQPYSMDEERVARFLADEVGIGGGDDPVGFILASHAELARQRNLLAGRLKAAGLSADVWGEDEPEPAPSA